MKIRCRPLAAALLVAAFFIASHAAWTPLKAQLGQRLLAKAWNERLAGAADARPWPWADTTPVARLTIPRLDLDQLVLAGASGRNLAWGPAAMTSVEGGDVVISAHRDTHFAGLNELQPGDRLLLDSGQGDRAYRVAWLDIVDSERQELVTRSGLERLTLVTCYPPSAPTAGGPLRLVVTALPEGDSPRASASQSATLSLATR